MVQFNTSWQLFLVAIDYTFRLFLFLTYYVIQRGNSLILDTTCGKELVVSWTIISHVKGRASWISSTVVYPEVLKAFLKIIIQTSQSMALNTLQAIKGQITPCSISLRLSWLLLGNKRRLLDAFFLRLELVICKACSVQNGLNFSFEIVVREPWIEPSWVRHGLNSKHQLCVELCLRSWCSIHFNWMNEWISS